MPLDDRALVADAARSGPDDRPAARRRRAGRGRTWPIVATRSTRCSGEGRPAFVPRSGATVGEVAAIVRAAGGVASLAHPGLMRLDDAIPGFVAGGLTAIEVWHSDHDAAATARYQAHRRAARARHVRRVGLSRRSLASRGRARRVTLPRRGVRRSRIARRPGRRSPWSPWIDDATPQPTGPRDRPSREALPGAAAAPPAVADDRAGRARRGGRPRRGGGRSAGQPGHRARASRTAGSSACSGATTRTSPTATSGWRPSIASGSSARARCCSKAATLEQNLAMPFTLQIDPVEPRQRRRVAALAARAG